MMSLKDKLGEVLDVLGDLDDLAQKTGSSVENLSKLQKVASAFGVDFGAVSGALTNLSKGLAGTDDESSKTKKALAALGLTARDSAGQLRDPADLMVDIAKRLQGYKDDAGKAALANDLFKKSGVELLPYMNDLADTVDEFSSVSADSASKAAAMQDSMGLLRVRSDELFTSIAVAGVPAMSDLAGGILDVMKAQDDLIGADAASWADDLAVGVARVVDVVTLLPRIFSAVSGSFKVVGADIQVLTAVAENANPVKAAMKWAKGGNPIEDINKAVAARNKVLADANAEYDRLWNQPANKYEQAVLARIAGRGNEAQSTTPAIADKPTLNYTSGKDSEKEAAEKAAEAYRALTTSIQAKIKQSQIEANTGRAATAAQQERLRVDEQLAKMNLNPQQRAFVEALLQELAATDEVIESNKRAAEGAVAMQKIRQEWLDSNAKALSDATEEAARNEALASTFGMTKSAIEQLEFARVKDQLAQRSSLGLTLEEIEHLEKLIAAKERSATALASVDASEAVKKAGEDLDRFLDPTKAQTFGEALKGAFGLAGDSLTQLISNLDAYSIRQAEVDKARKDAAMRFATDSKGYATASEAISRNELRSRVTAYGDMASAAKGFFTEGSKGYRTLETAEKAFRAYELVMAAEGLAKKLFFKEAEVAAHTTLNATKLAGESATTTASTTLAATEASAWGVTAVVKAIASLPFPLNLAAGAATLAAVLAVGAKVAGGGVGGSNISVSQARQEKQGTGSVFGDSAAKSDSIARALERVEDNTYQGLLISTGMLSALTAIKDSIGSFAALAVRDMSLTGKGGAGATGYDSIARLSGTIDGAGGLLSKFSEKITNAVLGGRKTLVDSGFTIDKTTLAAIADGGLNAMRYSDIKKDGGLFSSDKTSTQFAALGVEGNRQIAKVLLSLSDGIREAGLALGLPADAFSQKLDAFVVDIGKISFKDMKADEIEKTLQAVFSKLGDDMAQFAVGGLEQFQKVGEGYMETLARIAQGYQSVSVVMESMGMTFGAIGVDSIAARQRLLDLSGGLEKFVQSSEQFLKDFFTEQEQAAALKSRIQPILGQYGLSASGEDATKNFRNYLVALDPSTEAGAKAFAALSQIAPALKQIADAEQYIYDERKDLQSQLDELTMSSAQLLAKQRDALDESNRALFDQVQTATKGAAVLDERKQMQEQLDELTLTSAELLGRQRDALDESNRALFDQVQAAKKAASVLTERNGLQQQLDELTMTASQLLTKQRDALDESNRALFDQVQAARAQKDATQKASEAIRAAQEAAAASMKSFGDSVVAAMERATNSAKSMRDFANSLLLGNLSTLDADAKYREAKRLFEAADPSDTRAAEAFLQASKDRGGDSFYYERDFAAVQARLAAGAAALDAYAARLPDFYRGYVAMINSPAVVAPAATPVQGSISSSSARQADMSRVEAKVDALIEKIGGSMEQVANSTTQLADQFDRASGGGNKLRTEAA